MKTLNKQNTDSKQAQKHLLFKKGNYYLFFIGLGIIVVGFLLMLGGGSSNPDVFNKKMFDFQHITLSSLFLILGIVIEFFAIFYKPKNKKQE